MASLVKKKKKKRQSENVRLEFPGTARQLMLTEFLTDTTPHYPPARPVHSFIWPTCAWRHHCANPDSTGGPHMTNGIAYALATVIFALPLVAAQYKCGEFLGSVLEGKGKLTCQYMWGLPVGLC